MGRKPKFTDEFKLKVVEDFARNPRNLQKFANEHGISLTQASIWISDDAKIRYKPK